VALSHKMRYVLIDELWQIAKEHEHADGKRSILSSLRRRLFNDNSYSPITVEPYPHENGIFPISRYHPQSIEHHVLDPRGDENQHTNYIIPVRHYPKRAGSWIVRDKMTFSDAEQFIINYFSEDEHGANKIVETNRHPNRHIDLQRIENDFCQSIEVKLTSGHYKTAPGMIRSSPAQLHALLHYQNFPFLKQMIPSLYAIVSCDKLKMKLEPEPKPEGFEHIVFTKPHWYATVWFIPVYDEDDFLILNTLRQGVDPITHERPPPRTLLAYLRHDGRRIDPWTV